MKGVDLSYCYADVEADKEAIDLLADNCYLPANEIIHRLILAHAGRFHASFSISGTALELFSKHRPDVISSFKKLVATGNVEIMAETYYHSLSSLHSKKEFQRQVLKHTKAVTDILEARPAVFRNTELIHNNAIASQVADLGFKGLLCEGVSRMLHGRTPNKVYTAPADTGLGLLLRNAELSDDIAFRFDDVNWSEHPLTAEKFAEWLHAHPAGTDVINILLDYETFGIHKKAGTGILEFLEAFPAAVLTNGEFNFSTPSKALEHIAASGTYDVQETVSWENKASAACVWCDNMMQNNTLKKIYSIENIALHCGNGKAVDMWGRLQAADYFYYMSEESSKRATYRYHNPFPTPEEAFQNYCNIVADFEIALIENEIGGRKKTFAPNALINAL